MIAAYEEKENHTNGEIEARKPTMAAAASTAVCTGGVPAGPTFGVSQQRPAHAGLESDGKFMGWSCCGDGVCFRPHKGEILLENEVTIVSKHLVDPAAGAHSTAGVSHHRTRNVPIVKKSRTI